MHLRYAIVAMLLVSSDVVFANQGIVASWQPLAISQTLTAGTTLNVPLNFSYDNTTNAPVSYIVNIEDSSSCPGAASSHSWVPFAPVSGRAQAQTQGIQDVSIPLNVNGLVYGTYVTNVCFVANDPTEQTNVAVRVTLKFVADDDVFLDGFE